MAGRDVACARAPAVACARAPAVLDSVLPARGGPDGGPIPRRWAQDGRVPLPVAPQVAARVLGPARPGLEKEPVPEGSQPAALQVQAQLRVEILAGAQQPQGARVRSG